jgi:hypothetical protein
VAFSESDHHNIEINTLLQNKVVYIEVVLAIFFNTKTQLFNFHFQNTVCTMYTYVVQKRLLRDIS